LLIPIFSFLLLLINAEKVNAAPGSEDIYNVSNNVINNWNANVGTKDFPMTTGRKIVYDVYSDKYIKNGYQVITKDFGRGNQQYIHFT